MKSRKRKNYDIYISHSHWPLYNGRRILFVSSVLTFILNMSLIAYLNESMRKAAIISILLSVVFAIVQFVDNRKVHWNWPYIAILCAMFHIFSAIGVFSSESLINIHVWVVELILFSVFIGLYIYKKQNEKPNLPSRKHLSE